MSTTTHAATPQAPQGFLRKWVFSTDHKVIGLQYLFTAIEPLGETLGCVFYQVPKWVRKDTVLLREFLQQQKPGVKVAFEFAHASWFDEESFAVLREHDVALVASDKDEAPPPVLADTARWAYLRLRRPDYTDEALRGWRDSIRQRGLTDAFVFMKHEDSCAGPALARRFLDL